MMRLVLAGRFKVVRNTLVIILITLLLSILATEIVPIQYEVYDSAVIENATTEEIGREISLKPQVGKGKDGVLYKYFSNSNYEFSAEGQPGEVGSQISWTTKDNSDAGILKILKKSQNKVFAEINLKKPFKIKIAATYDFTPAYIQKNNWSHLTYSINYLQLVPLIFKTDFNEIEKELRTNLRLRLRHLNGHFDLKDDSPDPRLGCKILILKSNDLTC
jgi:hypothetical protein